MYPTSDAGSYLLRISKDIEIELVALHQERHDLTSRLEGLPTIEENTRQMQQIVAAERHRIGYNPYLIEPPQIPFPIPLPDPYPFGTPATLPSILCIGHFRSQKGNSWSYLSIIWFQDHFALPIQDTAVRAIKGIEWAKFAKNVPIRDE